jgi:hypothetical protein
MGKDFAKFNVSSEKNNLCLAALHLRNTIIYIQGKATSGTGKGGSIG